MKKPILLLVDDDPAVLDALEAELRPEFADICRIEAFDDPAEVIAALPRWTVEGRAVAVAIVDQKMPGMSGVELLVHARTQQHTQDAAPGVPDSNCPAPQQMFAMILTGYGGLDSALTAKNDAQVARYLEKPWCKSLLVPHVRTLLHSWMIDTGVGRHLLFRELLSAHDVERHLRLRFTAYRRTPAAARFLTASVDDLEVDSFDRESQLFGLFLVDPPDEQMTGSLRMTPWPAERASHGLEEALKGHPALSVRSAAPRPAALPCMTYHPNRAAADAFVADTSAHGERLVEGGRLAHVTTAVDHSLTREAPRHMIDAIHVVGWRLPGWDRTVISCAAAHAPFYESFGYSDIPGSSREVHAEFGVALAFLHGRPEDAPDPVSDRLDVIESRMRRDGSACRCAAFPICAASPDGPYATGDFTEVDVFCPSLAATRTFS